MNGEYKSKHITIFTYDDTSNQQIRNSIRNARVDLTQLFQRNDIRFIQTKQMYDNDKNEIQKFETFVNRIENINKGSLVVSYPNHHRNLW